MPLRRAHRLCGPPRHECERLRLWLLSDGDRSEHLVEVLTQRHRGVELGRARPSACPPVLGVLHYPCRLCPLDDVAGAGEIVACEDRAAVDGVDEVESEVVAAEVERSAWRTQRPDVRIHRRTIPETSDSQVSPGESAAFDLHGRSDRPDVEGR